MKRFFLLLLISGSALFLLSCEKAAPEPLIPGPDESMQDKAGLDDLILESIRSTGMPFDWNGAGDDMIMRALEFTGFPLAVGYKIMPGSGPEVRDRLLELVYGSEGAVCEDPGEMDDILVHRNDRLGFFHVMVRNSGTLALLRNSGEVRYLEPAGYPILMEEMAAYHSGQKHADHTVLSRDMILDPYQEDPDYFSQIQNYSGSTARCFKRHNVDRVYRDYDIYGENTGIAVLDNGLLPEYQAFLLSNGYGERMFTGYYNPLWFLPWTEPDGATPQSPDVLFLSQLIEGQWLHGWQQNEDVLMGSPNAAQYSVRASPLVLILVPAQVLGVINSIMAMADAPDIRIITMAMGSLFRIRQMEDAIDYFHARDKIMVSAAGTSFFFTRQLIGVIFPASYEPVLAVTGIKNREETGGSFVLGDNAHGGPQVDYCVEGNQSSSGATSRFAGMLGLVWSANPGLSRGEVIDIVTGSSNFYQELGHKYARFGWGTPDILQAVETAIAAR